MAKKRSKVDTKERGSTGEIRYDDVTLTPWKHVCGAFRFIFANLKLILPLMVVALVIYGVSFGVSSDTMVFVIVLAFLVLWLVTLFFARRVLAGEKVRFRDGLYNAMTPLISTFLVFVVLAIQCVPIMLLIIGYSAAVETNLFGDMFYGSLFVLFAILMVVISGYLLSGTLMALIAVSTPGMYPLTALELTHELMIGKKVEFTLKMLVLAVVLVVMGVVLVGPMVLMDLGLYNFWGIEAPMLVPVTVVVVGCFAVIYVGVYLYLYYRHLLGMDVSKK